MCAQLLIQPATFADRLNGCGLVIVRPPWKLDEELGRLLPYLRDALEVGAGEAEVSWLVKDAA